MLTVLKEYFDRDYYLHTYPEVKDGNIDPLEDYMASGWKLGRNPCVWFCSKAYLDTYQDVKDSGLNPFFHYLKFGKNEGRKIQAPDNVISQNQVSISVKSKPDQANLKSLTQQAQLDLAEGKYRDALNKVNEILAFDSRHRMAHLIGEQAAIEVGEFDLAKKFLLYLPTATIPPEPQNRGKNPVLYPRFKLPPIIGASNDYRHIMEQTELFKASNQPYTKTVSVIIPAYNRQQILANTLAALTHQTYPAYLTEIIVVDDGSDDAIFDVIKRYEKKLKLYYARQPDKGFRVAKARNIGLRLAKGDAIIFLDADVLPLPNTLEAYMQVLHVTDNAVLIGHRRYVEVSGIKDDNILANIEIANKLPTINTNNDVADKKDPNNLSIDWRFPLYKKTDYLITDQWPFIKAEGGNLAFSRKLQLKVGYMDEVFNAWGCEDGEFAYRLYNAGAYFIPMMNIISLHQEPLEKIPAIEEKSYRKAGYEITQKIRASKCASPYYRQFLAGSVAEIPKVSIYIPAYNAARYIVETVKSCLTQTCDDLEVVICDDGSTDNTLQILEEHFAGNPQVRWVSQKNGGIGKATNTAIKHCRGLYIAQLDADDLLKPQAVQTCIDLLDKTDIDAVYTDCDYIDETGQYIRDSWCGGVYLREWMATGMVATHFRMFRKRLWNRISGCNENIKNAVDLDLWLKLSEKGDIQHIHQILYSYRWHGDNTSIAHRKQQVINHHKVVADSLARRGMDRFWTLQVTNNPLNPREFKVVPVANPAPVTPQDVIFLIPTCTRYAAKQQAIRDTWVAQLGKPGFRFWFLKGNPELSAPCIQGDTLNVPCHDDYEHLLLKLVLGYQFIYRNLAFTHIYKIDDNCFPNLDKIVNEILPQLAEKQYAGGNLHPKGTKMNNTWHYGKCRDSRFDKPYPTDVQPFDFAKGGYGYFLRRDILPILFEQIETFKAELQNFQYSFEDVRIADILNQNNITTDRLEGYTVIGNMINQPHNYTVVYDIKTSEDFHQINRMQSLTLPTHLAYDQEKSRSGFKGAVVFVYASGVIDPNGTHFNSVLAYSSGFISYGYMPYYVRHDESHTLSTLLSELKQQFGHVIVHCEQSHGLGLTDKETNTSLAEALQIPFVSHVRDYSYCPWVKRNIDKLSSYHTVYHTDKLSAEFTGQTFGKLRYSHKQARHSFLPHVYFNNFASYSEKPNPASERRIGMLYVGSYFDPLKYRDAFKAKYPNDQSLFDQVMEASLYDHYQPVWEIARKLCIQEDASHFLENKEKFLDLIFNAGFFVRWTRRSRLLEEIAGYPLTLVWKGDLPRVKLHKDTTLLPPTSMEQTLALMSESRSMLMLLNNFTHSLSERLLSAMHSRCLAICNRNALIDESFVHGQDMFMFGSQFENLHESIEMTLNNTIDIDKMTDNAFNRVVERYSAARYAERVIKDHAMPPFA